MIENKEVKGILKGLKRALRGLVVLIVATAVLASCGGYGSSTKNAGTSPYTFRAFVSNPLHVSSAGSVIPVLEIIDAKSDTGAFFNINLQGSSTFPGMIALSPNKQFTIVYSTTDHSVATVSNAKEALATTTGSAGSSSTLGSISLPGAAVNMVFWTDNNTVFVPVPTATSVYNPTIQGDLEVLNLTSARISATIPFPGANYGALSPDGGHLLVFGSQHDPTSNTDEVAVVVPILIGSNASPISFVTGFDKPVGAVFNGNTAYVLDCGVECGGTGPASIVPLDVGSTAAGTPVPLSGGGISGGATVGLISGTNLFVAGTPPGTPCPSGTAATRCGILSVVDLGTMAVTATATITDGYHDRMQMGANGQLFIGSHTCSTINMSGEIRGCLSIVNAATPSGITSSSVVIPPHSGDVSGIQAIANRNIVYVCQGGAFLVFDTTTDKLLVQSKTINIVGQPTDVLLVDGPP
jgi:hypothetical protein